MKPHPLKMILPQQVVPVVAAARGHKSGQGRGRPIMYGEPTMVEALRGAAYEQGRNVQDVQMLSRRQYQEWVNRQPALKPSAKLIERHFGSWSRALGIAGLSPWQRAPRRRR